MAIQRIYAGATVAGMIELPSPTSFNTTRELIWSENTGRAQEGANKAKMIGSVVAEKITYEVQWGILTNAEYETIRAQLKGTASDVGFFYFQIATTLANAKANALKVYRSEIKGNVIGTLSSKYYKDVSVSIIEQ